MKSLSTIASLLIVSLTLPVWAAKPAKAKIKQQTVSALPFQSISKVEVAPELSNVSPYMRVRNLLNGRSLEVPIEGKDTIDLALLLPLVSDPVEKVMLEFSLYFLEKRSQEAVRGQLFDGTRDTAPILSPRRYQPAQAFWRRVGYSLETVDANHVVLHISSGIRTIFLSEKDAARRQEGIEQVDSHKNFDEAMKMLREKHFDLSLKAFDLILKNQKNLTAGQITEAYFARGLSKFHQLGCAASEEDFRLASRSPENADDIAYYSGLCKVEAKDFKGALPLFAEVQKSTNKTYEDPAKFYEGLCKEMLGQSDDAEAIYLDTVDFASDPAIVELAKARLEALKAAANHSWKPSWLMVGFSTAFGYDSNVVGLPTSLVPSDYKLTSQSSPTILVAPLVSAFYQLKQGVIESWRYTFANIYYTNSTIEDSYGLMSHDLSTSFFIAANEKNNHAISLGANSIFLGGFKNASEFMRVYTVDYVWTRLTGEDGKEPNTTWNYEFKTQLQFPQQAQDTTTDLEAYSYQLALTRLKTPFKNQAAGFSLRAEYKPSKGIENSVADAGGSLIYHRPMFGWQSTKLEQSLDLDGYLFYQSSTDRKDLSAKYNIGLSRSLIENVLDARLSFQYQMNFSTVAASYRYNKYTGNLSLSGSF